MMRKSDQSNAPQPRHPQAGMGLMAARRSWEQKRPEEPLRPRATEREESLRRLADAIPEVLWTVALDPERVLYVSPSFERVWGLSAEALYREPRLWAEAIHPEDRPRVTERFSRWVAGDDVDYHDVEYRILQPSGEIRWILDRGVLFHNENGRPREVSGISTDITERKRIQAALQASEDRYRSFIEQTAEGICRMELDQPLEPGLGEDAQIDYFYAHAWLAECNDAMARMYGYQRAADLVGARLGDLLPRSDPHNVEYLRAFVRGGYRLTDAESHERGRDGEERYFLNNLTGIVEDGRLLRAWGSQCDVTAHRLAEAAVRESGERLAFALEAGQMGTFDWHISDGQISSGRILWSPTVERLHGYDPGTLPADAQSYCHQVHPEDRERVCARLHEILAGTAGHRIEYRIVRPDGEIRWLECFAKVFPDGSGHVVRLVGVCADVTERKEAEGALERAYQEIQALKDQLQDENIALREEVDKASMFEEIVGTSPALQTVLANIAKVAPTDSTVLITGETGTGKELVARAIHKHSPRAGRPFVSVNCAAIPAPLIASELFGHEKGAFTGAVQRRLGRFELADGGTLFLDEVGELPAETQVALLRVLQEREFERVGGQRPIRADVRVIAATNRELETAIAEKTFRADLFYRLNVFPLEVPALRDRRGDIPLLVEYFTHRFGTRAGKRISTIPKATLDALQGYDWPGNIRELQNVIERAVIISDGSELSVDLRWLSASPSKVPSTAPTDASSSRNTLVEDERSLIEAVLAEAMGRVSGPFGAATKLAMPASTLESKIKALRIDKSRFKPVPPSRNREGPSQGLREAS
jgi:PAS domain S-box-containing protein